METARHLLIATGWPTLLTNRIAFGLAKFALGGKLKDDMPTHHLSVADFVKADPEEIEAFVVPTENKLEARPRAPATIDRWRRQVFVQITVLQKVCAEEHGVEMRECIEKLLDWHETTKKANPFDFVTNLWEELMGVWCEQIREGRRLLCRKLGTEHPRKEEIRFIALAPDETGAATWRFPDVFDLDSENGYYQIVVLPRRQRRLENCLLEMAHRPPIPPKKTGGGDPPSPAPAAADESEKARGGSSAKRKGKGKGKEKTNDPNKSAYPAGKALKLWELKRSAKHSTQDKNGGKPPCWDNSCHGKCSRTSGSCHRSNWLLKGVGALDWTVMAQCLRRGGLRSGPPAPIGEIDGRIQQLRARPHAEEAS